MRMAFMVSIDNPRINAARLANQGALLLATALLLSACAGQAPEVPASQAAALSEPSEVSGSLARLGDFMNTRGDRATAIALYQRAALQTDDIVELVQIARALTTAGAPKDAITTLRRATSLHPTNAYALGELGTLLLADGQVASAAEVLQRASTHASSGNKPRTFRLLGVAYELGGQPEQAQGAFREGLEIDPDNLDLLSNLALSLSLSDKHEDAVIIVRAFPGAPGATVKHHRNMVLVLALAGMEKEAAQTGVSLIGPTETARLLDQGRAARQLTDRDARAAVIGILRG